ncbi:MAG TPA: LysR family transcriptional regulator [Chthoniobacteraceae bacterium]|jgi:DNA-binding transcriptional LysR family regulator|nr:LysR family transcriptional regulator [Chthoniobacteraceae bacterium]
MSQPLDSRQLRAFAALARTGSFTVTAHELHLTQSAISHALKGLEADVGCRLFDRLGKKAVLTQAGEQLLAHAEKILAEMEVARAELGRLGKWGSSRLRIGASTTACQHVLPGVLREFKESFPQCAISIEPGDTPEMIAALQAHRIDLAVNLEPHRNDRLDFRPLFTDELVFVVSPLHPWAKAKKVVRDQIARQQYILYGKGSYTFAMIEQYFRKEEIVLHSLLELGNMEAIKELVKLGLGVSILAPWTARKELEEGSLVTLPLGQRKLKRRWGVLHWQGRRLSLAEETFIGLCESVAERLG